MVAGNVAQRAERFLLDGGMLWREVSVEKWIEMVRLPYHDIPPSYVYPAFEVVIDKLEKDMYPGLCAGINAHLSAAGSELRAFSTEDLADDTAPGDDEHGDRNALRPDLIIYPNVEEALQASGALSNADKEGTIPTPANAPGTPQSEPPNEVGDVDMGDQENLVAPNPASPPTNPKARVSWAWAELVVVVSNGSNVAPFSVDFSAREPLQAEGMDRSQSRGQLAEYAKQLFNRQHREYVLMLSIYHDYARLLRFDRNGAIVSKPFQYTGPEFKFQPVDPEAEEPISPAAKKPARADEDYLGMFLYCFARMSAEARGHDPTVTPASKEEVEIFNQLHAGATTQFGAGSAIAEGIKLAGTPGWRLYKMDIHAPWSKKGTFLNTSQVTESTLHHCLVGRPATTEASMASQGTRGFVAYDLEEKSVVFIKDSWRALVKGRLSEFNIYQLLVQRLGSDAINNGFLTLRAGGDVFVNTGEAGTSWREQETMTTTGFEGPDWYPLRRHCRLVVDEICRPLTSFATPLELIDCLHDAISAHAHAWVDAGILHRDISPSNILICEKSPGIYQGILSDWDLAKTKEQLNKRGQWSRSFMSAGIQCYPRKPYEAEDDLGSFLHVLNWCTFRYIPHSLSGDDTDQAKRTARSDAFYAQWEAPHVEVGTTENLKFSKVLGGRRFVEGLPLIDGVPGSNPLDNLLGQLTELFSERYRATRWQQWGTKPIVSSKSVEVFSEPDAVLKRRLAKFKLINEWEALCTRQESKSDPVTGLPPSHVTTQPTSQHALHLPSATPPSYPPQEVKDDDPKRLVKHVTILKLIEKALMDGMTKPWPTACVKVPDQVPNLLHLGRPATGSKRPSADSHHSLSGDSKRRQLTVGSRTRSLGSSSDWTQTPPPDARGSSASRVPSRLGHESQNESTTASSSTRARSRGRAAVGQAGGESQQQTQNAKGNDKEKARKLVLEDTESE
ncbi:hypothetical protein BD413DRAFT_612452 [Trametes elegans]|nr:hypothetical protein BD413DRAFT_612452 [Trametes elegans]